MMWLNVENVIYFYIAICVALLLFNLFYITRSKRVKRRRVRRTNWWEQTLENQFSDKTAAVPNIEKLFIRLKNTEELMAFGQVLGTMTEKYPNEIKNLFLENRQSVYGLALEYGKRPAMERAFFAYILATFHPPVTAEQDLLTEILLEYLEDSTVYCRENVLCALYALGREQAVEHAFEILNERGWYHHPRLLSDGMAKFTGDLPALIRRLWRNRKRWADFLLIAVVQVATALSEDFSEPFLEGLRKESLPLEVRFALIRYFGRHHCPEAKSVLLGLLGGDTSTESSLAIVVVSALARYPGSDTMQVLKNALHSRNWYVRHNAASSLATLGITREEEEEILLSGDRYAIEMLEYMTGTKTSSPAVPESEKEAATV